MSTRTLCPGQPGYPPALLDLPDPPLHLYVRGPLDLAAPRVAVVGTRRPSERGRGLAERLGEGLARAGVTVVSGGALGIDGAAHRGAVRGGGPTWVVLPSPLASPAPPSHRGLFEEVLASGGAWLSELSEGEAGLGKRAFFQRNRLVAALADVVVAVEAKLQSGTRHTMQAALQLGRTRAAFPWPAGEVFGAGCVAWLREGAHRVTGPEEVLPLLGPQRPSPPGPGPAPTDPLLAALLDGPQGADALAARLGLPVAAVLSRLTLLEITQQVSAHSGGVFCLTGAVAEGRP
jgi:DNA processing protein